MSHNPAYKVWLEVVFRVCCQKFCIGVVGLKFYHVPQSDSEYKVTAQSLEDLWYLSRIIADGDEAEGGSFRRFKASGGQEAGRGESGEKKAVRIRLKVQQVEFAESANKLRLTGRIISGTPEEFVPQGDFHTLDVEISRPFTLYKALGALDRSLVEEAREATGASKATLAVIDDESAGIYLLNARGLKLLFETNNHASKRDPSTFETLRAQFYSEVLSGLQGQSAQSPLVVVAGPGFARDSFIKYAAGKDPALAKKIISVHASSAQRSAVHELLKGGLLENVLGRQKMQREFEALEEFKRSLGKGDGFCVYGLEAVGREVQAGSVRLLMVADELLRKDSRAAQLVGLARSIGASILVFDSSDDAGAEFSGFAIAAMLRYSKKYEG
jgi:protein pelota